VFQAPAKYLLYISHNANKTFLDLGMNKKFIASSMQALGMDDTPQWTK
jgi:hypothetical protein